MSEQFQYMPFDCGQRVIDLITPEHFDLLSDGTELTTFFSGNRVHKGDGKYEPDFVTNDAGVTFIDSGFPGQASRLLPYEGPYRSS